MINLEFERFEICFYTNCHCFFFSALFFVVETRLLKYSIQGNENEEVRNNLNFEI